jgi:hypothetical protein
MPAMGTVAEEMTVEDLAKNQPSCIKSFHLLALVTMSHVPPRLFRCGPVRIKW